MISGGSLCEIFLQRYPEDSQPVLVMLGLTDAELEAENYGQAEPERTVRIVGRELSCLLVDQRTLYVPAPPRSLEPRQVASTRKLPLLPDEQVQLLGMIAIDPELATIGASPVDVIDRFVTMVRTGLKTNYNPDGRPLLNLQFPDAEIKDLLFFDKARAEVALFDPAARLPASSQMINTGESPWNLMSTWSDPAYQELWSRTVDLRQATLGDRRLPVEAIPKRTLATVEIIFRKKPFAGRINAQGDLEGLAALTGTQFDQEFARRPGDNVEIGDSVVLGLSLTRSTQDIVNLYYVYPQVPGFDRPEDFRALYRPLIDASPLAPSSVQRFGPRLMNVADYYFRDLTPGSHAGERRNPVEIANSRAELLWAWYRFNGLFKKGRYTIRGNTRVSVGKRGVHRGRNMNNEYYITGVAHSVPIGSREPMFISTVDVERGWPLG